MEYFISLNRKIEVQNVCYGAGLQSSVCPPPYPQDDPLKYSLCFRNHPANYKYCLIYRELQRRKKPTFKNLTILHINANGLKKPCS
ncbi:Uncharacterized protein FWK35_00012307 [Aphis craccivora]|uniref:Uncharacterized protein n=1 Tax=Aphis craccivora TaxID=307492 RepID=A0A6G0YNN5_APHCR|nr:Uncharacterized protein FWK35_00012307 [Aphis craccivora]